MGAVNRDRARPLDPRRRPRLYLHPLRPLLSRARRGLFTQEEKAQALAAISGTPLADKADSIWRASGADEVIDVPADQACPLLGPEGCTIQAVKPAQCRTYPFWPELLQSRGAWESEKGRCEGIDLGPNHYAYADIFELLSGRKDTRENS